MRTVIIFFYYEKLSYIMQLELARLSLFMQRPHKTVRRFGLQHRKAFPKAHLPELDHSLRPLSNLPVSHL